MAEARGAEYAAECRSLDAVVKKLARPSYSFTEDPIAEYARALDATKPPPRRGDPTMIAETLTNVARAAGLPTDWDAVELTTLVATARGIDTHRLFALRSRSHPAREHLGDQVAGWLRDGKSPTRSDVEAALTAARGFAARRTPNLTTPEVSEQAVDSVLSALPQTEHAPYTTLVAQAIKAHTSELHAPWIADKLVSALVEDGHLPTANGQRDVADLSSAFEHRQTGGLVFALTGLHHTELGAATIKACAETDAAAARSSSDRGPLLPPQVVRGVARQTSEVGSAAQAQPGTVRPADPSKRQDPNARGE